jgi:hypothetical protein
MGAGGRADGKGRMAAEGQTGMGRMAGGTWAAGREWLELLAGL